MMVAMTRLRKILLDLGTIEMPALLKLAKVAKASKKTDDVSSLEVLEMVQELIALQVVLADAAIAIEADVVEKVPWLETVSKFTDEVGRRRAFERVASRLNFVLKKSLLSNKRAHKNATEPQLKKG